MENDLNDLKLTTNPIPPPLTLLLTCFKCKMAAMIKSKIHFDRSKMS